MLVRLLSSSDLIRTWETGLGQHHLERALTLLSAAEPEVTRNELASLSIGKRDARLLALREKLFGSSLNCLAECPHCREGVEFTLKVSDLLDAPIVNKEAKFFELTTSDLRIRFRPLNSEDLMAAATCKDLETARRTLLERCVLKASRHEMELAVLDFPEEIIAELTSRLAECDSQADIVLKMECVACSRPWELVFDIASYLWSEVNAMAKRLLREVHTLAWAYGWSEADILAMSDARRRLYLDMVG
jgi:hypothetical protein